eukprot:scaffold8167_cov444-Prasinococcus_capsulatus_cf.AAC.2
MACTSAPRSRRQRTLSCKPALTAPCSGVRPLLSLWLTSAPRCSSRRAAARLLPFAEAAARCSSVRRVASTSSAVQWAARASTLLPGPSATRLVKGRQPMPNCSCSSWVPYGRQRG